MHGPIATTLRADGDYRDARASMAARPAQYYTYQNHLAGVICDMHNPRYVPVGGMTLDGRAQSMRERGAAKSWAPVPVAASPFHHGGLAQSHSAESSLLRIGDVIRGSMPPPTTQLMGKGKFQAANGSVDTIDADTKLRSSLGTTRRDMPRAWTPLITPSGLRQSDGFATLPEQTADRSRGKAWLAETQTVPVSADTAALPPLAVEDFPLGGAFTRENMAEFSMVSAVTPEFLL